jgi:PAS domain S-box-containing protein
MNQSDINGYRPFITNNQSTEILKPGNSSLQYPSSSVSVQFSSILTCIAVFLIGFLVLLGWIFDIDALRHFVISPVTMRADAATSFILMSISLWLMQIKHANRWTRYAAQGCIFTVLLIASFRLIEFLFLNIGIGQLLFHEPITSFSIVFPDRMSLITAANFFLISIALLLTKKKNLEYCQPAKILLVTVILTSSLIFLGYSYGVKPFSDITSHMRIALHTTITFIILSTAILSLHSNRGIMVILTGVSTGQRLIRRLLGTAILILPFFGWLSLLGKRKELYNTEFCLSIEVMLSIVIFAFLIWRSALVIDRKDTEYKQIEKQLYEANQKLKFHMENSPLAIIECDSDCRIVRWNEQAEMIFGWNSEEMVGKRVNELHFVYEEDWDKVRQVMADMVGGLCLSNVTKNRNYRRDGSVISCEWYNSALLDSSGKLVSLLSFVLDVTDQKKAEEALKESEKQYRLLFENSPNPMWILDQKTLAFLAVNEAAIHHYGYSREEFLSMTIKDIRPSGDIPKLLNYLEHARPELSYADEWKHQKKDNTLIDVEIRKSTVIFNGKKDILVMAYDITRRKRMEKKLQENHRTLEALMEYVPEGITIADAPDVNIHMVSKFGIQLTGRPQEELKGIPAERHVKQWDILHPDGTTPALPEELPLIRATQKGEVVMDEEWVIRRPDGGKITILCNAGPIKNNEGTITGGVITWRDITRRKQLEEEIKNVARFPLENPYLVLRIAQNGTLLFANPSSQFLLSEWNCDVGQTIPDFLYRFVKDAFHSGKIKKGIDIEYKDQIFSFTLVPVINASYVNLYGIDVTEQRRAENELKKHQEQLEEFVKVLKVINEKLHLEIEERKQAEDILEKEQQFLKTILDTIEAGIVACDSHGILTLFNRAAQEFHGLPLEPLPAEQWAEHYDLYLPDAATKMKKEQIPLFRTLQGETVRNAELMIAPKRGTARLMLTSGQALVDRYGKKFGAVIVMHDITERKRAEEALRASESKYRLLIENLPQRVFYKGKNLSYISCNKIAARDLDIRPDDIYGKTDYDLFPKELADKYKTDDKRIMESGEKAEREEVFITNDGKELILHAVKTPIKDEKGNVIGILSCSLDITEKITLQKEAEHSRHLASLGELAAGVGHEINNPITGVINCAQILFNKNKEGSRERDLAIRIIKEGVG